MTISGNAPYDRPHRRCTRRGFLAALAAAGTVAAFPAAADIAPLSENDATAQALGYRNDAAQVDAAKYPQHQPTQICANCNFFQGSAASGPCQLFPGKSVSAKGWCSAYAAKAG